MLYVNIYVSSTMYLHVYMMPQIQKHKDTFANILQVIVDKQPMAIHWNWLTFPRLDHRTDIYEPSLDGFVVLCPWQQFGCRCWKRFQGMGYAKNGTFW